MKGLCAPPEQGNAQDGIWIEHKEVLRLRKIAVDYEAGIARASLRGTLIGVTVAFLLMALINSGTVRAEDRYVEAWVEAEEVVEEELEGERCYAPYAPKLSPEFEVENMSFTVYWYDTKEELVEDVGDLFGARDFTAASDCEKKPEFNISYCDLYLVRPISVDDDATMSVGHEVLHGLLGAYHE